MSVIEVKYTKDEILAALADYFTNNFQGMTIGVEKEIPVSKVIEYAETAREQLASKAAKAKEKAAEKKAENPIKVWAMENLTNEMQGADTITAAIIAAHPDADVTKAKVTARLSALAREGQIVKGEIKVGDRKVVAYALFNSDFAEDEVPAE